MTKRKLVQVVGCAILTVCTAGCGGVNASGSVSPLNFLLPGLISGSVIFEQIFAWPGLGLLGYEAISARDFPMILTLNFIAAALTLFGILISDILYAVVDPRIRVQ